MEEKQIKAVCDWPEPQLVPNIQIFLGFTNFYQQFIQGFSKLAAPLIFMLKTTSTVGPTASIEVRDENPEKDSQGVQVEDQGEKKPVQKSCKGQKSQKNGFVQKMDPCQKSRGLQS